MSAEATPNRKPLCKRETIEGFLLGTAVGDSIGLPFEGLSSKRIARRLRDRPLEHGLILRRGMCSDDTEHTCMLAQSWLACDGDALRFARKFAWRLRFWLLCLPAGTGLATARGILKLWIGFPPSRSGICSAGNGAAMRSGVLGLLEDDPDRLAHFVRASTRITHTDPRAEQGAMAIAVAARIAASDRIEIEELREEILGVIDDDELRSFVERAIEGAYEGKSATTFAEEMGMSLGISGFVNHTVPIAIFCWIRHRDDFRAGIEAVVRLGGDADTTAAITGGLLGATLGPRSIPETWLSGLIDWPRSKAWIRRLAVALSEVETSGARSRPIPLFVAGIPVRNLVFLLIVVGHGFRRLVPP